MKKIKGNHTFSKEIKIVSLMLDMAIVLKATTSYFLPTFFPSECLKWEGENDVHTLLGEKLMKEEARVRVMN